MGGVGRFGIACVATAAAVLGPVQVAFAQEAPPPPPPSESSTTEPTPEAPPPPPSTTATETAATDPPPAETTDPSPAPDAPAEPEAAPAEGAEAAPDAQAPAPDATATTTETAAPAPDPTPFVKLEPEAPASTAPAPAAAPTASAPAPAAQPPSGAPPETSVVLVTSPPAATPASLPASPATKAETAAAAAALIPVSFRPRSAIELLPDDEPAFMAPVAPTRAVAAPRKSRVVRQTCVRPAALVPLSLRCKQQAVEVVVAGSRLVRIILRSPSPEVRAAIDRAAVRMTARRVEASPPPDSKAAAKKEHPIAKVRPIIPFGWSSGEGASHDGFSGSSGSSWSSRVVAIAIVPLRVPRPFRFARIRLPSTIAHGVIAAPPTARPG